MQLVKAAGEKRELTVKEFAEMLQAALQGIQSIGERSFGRGAVVGERSLGYPDAGAHALGIFLILFFDIYC
nr:hypothetical protein [Bacillus cereus]